MEESIKEFIVANKDYNKIEGSTKNIENCLDESKISNCCKKTIMRHAAFNPMILCSGCQHIIKCFNAEKYFSQYVKFCKSRGRKVIVGFIDPYYIVIYRTFDSSSL